MSKNSKKQNAQQLQEWITANWKMISKHRAKSKKPIEN